jgi:glycosyltransferase involved in cell wall biosynthesis
MDLGVVGNRRSVAGDLMLPVKLMEYVALGLPAVAPRLRTITHYFTDEMVTYYEAENIQSMADAIYTLYGEPELRARQVHRARAFLNQYGWERQGVELVNFYQDLVER